MIDNPGKRHHALGACIPSWTFIGIGLVLIALGFSMGG